MITILTSKALKVILAHQHKSNAMSEHEVAICQNCRKLAEVSTVYNKFQPKNKERRNISIGFNKKYKKDLIHLEEI